MKYSYTIFLSIITQLIFAQCLQDASGDKKQANDYYSYGQYTCALREYMYIWNKDKKDEKTNFRIADCILRIDGNRAKALPYLRTLLAQKRFDDEVLFMAGKAYHYAEKFDSAIIYFNKYLATGPGSDETFVTNEFIKYCNNAKNLVKFKVNVQFENLGEDVNSEWNETTPYVGPQEDYVIFTTSREGTTGNYPFRDGFVTDVYVSKLRRNEFSRARSMGGLFNTIDLDEVAGGSADGNTFFFTTDADYQIFNLKISQMTERSRSFPKPELLEGINGKNSNEICATINNAQNLIIFSSDREGGFGGYDLWMSRQLPNGNWGTPINLGPEINTDLDELYPMFQHDQTSIVFSSNGHYSMGEFDLFKTTFSDELKTWTFPKNLGYPINTPYSDLNIAYTPTGRYAYKSAWRKGSYGKQDIYRLTFLDETPQFTVLKGIVPENDTIQNLLLKNDSLLAKAKAALNALPSDSSTLAADSILAAKFDSLKTIAEELNNKQFELNPYESMISIQDVNNGQVTGEYKFNKKKGEFVAILEPGRYEVTIDHPVYGVVKNKITIYDKESYSPLVERSYNYDLKNLKL
jgi:hypothetical protein